MYELTARNLEEDLLSTGVADAFGEIGTAVRSVRFEDKQNGFYRGTGGLIGEGGILVDRYRTTAMTMRLLDSDFINYERALSGSATLVQGDTQLSSRDGIATVARQHSFEMNFLPVGQILEGLQIALILEALDRYLATGGEERHGPVEYRVLEGSGLAGPDGALLSLGEHVLNEFELYRQEAGTRRAKLAEALLTEVFIQLLRDIGALTLKERAHGATANMISRAEEFMRDRFSEPITMADVAAAAGVNLRSLQSGFREILGTTPRQYLRLVRLERARELLLADGTAGITTVAYECGIMHSGRFAQAYRARYGQLPSETARGRRKTH